MDRLQVLVGPNASGKSTLLDVIAFISDLIRNDLETAVRDRARTLKELVWQGEANGFETAVELKLKEPVHAGKNGSAYTHCRYELAVELAESTREMRISTENFFLLRDAMPASAQQTQMELFPVEGAPRATIVLKKGRQTPKGWRKVISRDLDGSSYYRSESTGWNFPMRLGPRKAALAAVPEEERFAVANWAKQTLMEGTHVLALNSQAMRLPCPPDAKRTYLPDGSNIPIVLRDLVRPGSDRFQRWVSHVQTVLTGVTDITVEEQESDKHPYLAVKFGDGLDVPSWLLSDGTLRLFALTLLAYLPPESQDLYMIEEPENGIHPKAIEAIYQSLSTVYDGQVFLATHSPLILGLAEPEQMLCFAQAPSGGTCIVKGSDHPALRDWRGDTPIETLYAAGVLG